MEAEVMKSLDAFVKLLTQESNHLKDLLGLEDDKYEALKQVELKQLMRINALEEEELHALEAIEKKRKLILLSLSGTFHFDPSLSLADLLKVLPEEGFSAVKTEMAEVRMAIKNLTQKLQVTMKENSEMIHSNLEIINLTLNFANRNAQKETYGYRSKRESADSIYLVNQLA